MTCLICKKGSTEPGKVTVTLERGRTTIIFKGVPAMVCATCGEVYIDSATSKLLLDEASKAATNGVEVEIRAFAA